MSDPNILKEKAIEEEKINLLDEGDFMEYKVSELVELMCRLNCNVPEFFFFFLHNRSIQASFSFFAWQDKFLSRTPFVRIHSTL